MQRYSASGKVVFCEHLIPSASEAHANSESLYLDLIPGQGNIRDKLTNYTNKH